MMIAKAAQNVQRNPRQVGKANFAIMFSRRHQRVNERRRPPGHRPMPPPPGRPRPPSSPWLPVVAGGFLAILVIALALMISSGPLVVPVETPTTEQEAVAMLPTETATVMLATHTAVPTPTATKVPPTATPVPPTATPVPPTATQAPPTLTPTATEAPLTLTPTATEVLPTLTPTPTEVPPTPTQTPTPVPATATRTPTPTAYTIEVYFFFHHWCDACQMQARDFERLAQSYRSTGLHQGNRTFVLAAIAFVLPPIQEEVRVDFYLVPLSGSASQHASFQARYAPSVPLGQNPSLRAQYSMSVHPVVIATNKSTGENAVLSRGRTSYSSMKSNLEKSIRGDPVTPSRGWT